MSEMTYRLQATVQRLCDYADVRLGGDRPWDIEVHNPGFYPRVLKQGSIGLGESYMDGWWDSAGLDQLFTRINAARLAGRLGLSARLRVLSALLWDTLINRQSIGRARQVATRHYDLGNDLFECMLDTGMNYSCGYWRRADSLDEAQRHKIRLICDKLRLEPGHRVLDIGCGWGGLAEYLAREHEAHVTGLTISREQCEYARRRVSGLPVDIRLLDYRKVSGSFDRIVSVGMFEHVGRKNYRLFFEKAAKLLKPEGLFLLHTIGAETLTQSTDAFIDKYIFPNSKIPNRAELSRASEGLFRLEDWHNFGPDYDRTLMAWLSRFEAAWPKLQGRYSERFYRMWRYYLCCCAGYFRSRRGELWQLVFSHPLSDRPYLSLR